MIILAIETSCDETSLSLHRGHRLIDMITNSQSNTHSKHGGVIPELAARMHTESIVPTLRKLIQKNKLDYTDIDYIAFTSKPGLIGPLQVGLIIAKTLKMLLNKPLISIDHLHGHLLSPFINEKKIEGNFPILGSVISGGHTNVYLLNNSNEYTLLAKSDDEAMGDVYDKVGRYLKLSYPAGPEIDKLTTDKDLIKKFSVPKTKKNSFSFSGIRSQVKREIENNDVLNNEDIINSFQFAMIKHYLDKILIIKKDYPNIDNFVLSGGVSNSEYIRNKLITSNIFKKVYFSERIFCSDNAAMIGYVAYQKIINNKFIDENLDIDSYPST